MTTCLILATVAVTIAAAVRSTWSPCGLSMLATMTPLSEAGRGHRYRSTAGWFVLGSTAGGATLGVCSAVVTVALDVVSLTPTEVKAAASAACVVAIASDAGLGGFRLPVHHRQVNERWLDRFRPWVYGVGFGWQIGSGLATYIMTAAVYLMIALSTLIGAPWLAFGFGILFGLVRGLSVFLGRHITTTETLTAFHLRFFALGPKVGRIIIFVEVVVAILFAWLLSPWAALAVLVVAVVPAYRRVGKWRGAGVATSIPDENVAHGRLPARSQ